MDGEGRDLFSIRSWGMFCFSSSESHLSHDFCQTLNTVLNKMFCAVHTGPPLPRFGLLNNPCILSVLHHCPLDMLPPSLNPETPRRAGSPPLVSNLLTQRFLSVAPFSSSAHHSVLTNLYKKCTRRLGS